MIKIRGNPQDECPHLRNREFKCWVRDGATAVQIASTGWGAGERKICSGCKFAIGLLREYRERYLHENGQTKIEAP